jgi:FkbM family methyltransferase
MKETLKNILKKLPFNVTRNQKYDALTLKIMEIVLEENSSFVDVGCHKGELLEEALKLAPNGAHYAFEPIPDLFDDLISSHGKIAVIKNVALSDKRGSSTFNYVKSNPAYSGIKQRSYPKKEKIQEIDVKIDTMDNQLKNAERINLIKIDVEGGEMGVLKGSVNTLKKWSPVVIFEHGLGASDYYGTTPEEMWEFLNDNDYCIFSLRGFVANKTSLSIEQFINLFETNKEYYFIAKAKV